MLALVLLPACGRLGFDLLSARDDTRPRGGGSGGNGGSGQGASNAASPQGSAGMPANFDAGSRTVIDAAAPESGSFIPPSGPLQDAMAAPDSGSFIPPSGPPEDAETSVPAPDSAAATVCVPEPLSEERDADHDGVIDVFDPDDDNDGLSDLAECSSVATELINSGFEDPVVNTDPLFQAAAVRTNVPGWATTSPLGQIELWETNAMGVPSGTGVQHVELNQMDPDTLSQEIPTEPLTTLRWGFQHRGRAGDDTMELWIGDSTTLTLALEATTGNTSWQTYQGTYLVPAGQVVTRFEFRAISPLTSGGNFMDSAQVEPICTLDTDGDGCVDTEDPD